MHCNPLCMWLRRSLLSRSEVLSVVLLLCFCENAEAVVAAFDLAEVLGAEVSILIVDQRNNGHILKKLSLGFVEELCAFC